MKPLEKPLNRKQVKEIQKPNGFITVVVPMDFNDLIDNDLEGVNDIAEELILKEGNLSDITYKPVGVAPDNLILVEVTAEVEFWDGEDEEGELVEV